METGGDSYDDALAETVIGLFKTEDIKPLWPWKKLGDIEWYTETRLLSTIGYIPPAEAEKRFLEDGQLTAEAA